MDDHRVFCVAFEIFLEVKQIDEHGVFFSCNLNKWN